MDFLSSSVSTFICSAISTPQARSRTHIYTAAVDVDSFNQLRPTLLFSVDGADRPDHGGILRQLLRRGLQHRQGGGSTPTLATNSDWSREDKDLMALGHRGLLQGVATCPSAEDSLIRPDMDVLPAV